MEHVLFRKHLTTVSTVFENYYFYSTQIYLPIIVTNLEMEQT